ncbi:MAG: SRPBCC domain-containing protein [Promethearchaeota archaeon]
MENIIYIREEIECDIPTAFKFFTKNDMLESWLTEKADVNPEVGGKYELFWEPENREINSTIGCMVTGIEENKFISFDWKGPVQFKTFMNISDPLTHVIVFFSSDLIEKNKTIIYLFHTGWRKDERWQRARKFFENAWIKALHVLKEKVKDKLSP